MAHLTTKQKRAITALLSEPTTAAAAEKAKVGRRTLYRWLAEDDTFRRELSEAEALAVEDAARTMASGAAEAVNALRDVLTNRNEDARTRVAAANSFLSHLPKVRLLGSLENKINRLVRSHNAKSQRSK